MSMESEEKRSIRSDMSTETSRRCCCIVDVDWSNMYASPADIRQYLIRLKMLIKDYFPTSEHTCARACVQACTHTNTHTHAPRVYSYLNFGLETGGLRHVKEFSQLLFDRWLAVVVIFFAFCLLLLTGSVAGIACRACHLSGTFLSFCHKHRQRRRHSYTQTRTHTQMTKRTANTKDMDWLVRVLRCSIFFKKVRTELQSSVQRFRRGGVCSITNNQRLFTPTAHERRESLPVWPPTFNKIPILYLYSFRRDMAVRDNTEQLSTVAH